MIVESIAMGAKGWIAGLVNALPAESVQLFDLASSGRRERARALYDWFLPLLRLDTLPKFVQAIKLVQAEVGRGSARVRPPRLELAGEELRATLALISFYERWVPLVASPPRAGASSRPRRTSP